LVFEFHFELLGAKEVHLFLISYSDYWSSDLEFSDQFSKTLVDLVASLRGKFDRCIIEDLVAVIVNSFVIEALVYDDTFDMLFTLVEG
jgi:hypothetical protein